MPRPNLRPLALLTALLLVELVALSLIYKHAIAFTCLANAPPRFCGGASGALLSILTFLAGGALYLLLRPGAFATLLAEPRLRPMGFVVHGVGLGLTLLPLMWLRDGVAASGLIAAMGLWVLGMALVGLSLIAMLAPLPRWRSFWMAEGWTALIVALGGALAPALATVIRPLWQVERVSDVTFRAVGGLISTLGYKVDSFPERKVFVADDFGISVAPVCSGIEGIALMAIFITLFLLIFRADLKFPRVLILYPLGMALSWILNVLRIAVLMIIGIEGNPELAVGGFHSHAGWVMFTLLAMGMIWLAHGWPWLHRHRTAQRAAPRPLRSDPIAAAILPFVAFMVSELLAAALSQTPGVVYPLRVLVLSGALWVFAPALRSLRWGAHPVALGLGLAIAVLWILWPVAPSDGPPPYGTLTGGWLMGWMVLRGLGTTVLVPVVEELFFRGYLEQRLRLRPGRGWQIGAAVATAAVFAALHGRWAEAFIASLLLSLAMARRNRVTDAILAHAVANGLIFVAALVLGRLDII